MLDRFFFSGAQVDSFGLEFRKLTGHPPLVWQARLFEQICQHGLPDYVDVPTGLGKTSVMAIWLLAFKAGHEVPRRLVYVVDRRAVVDQATTFAERLRENASLAQPLPISTLRGQFADNREWLEDPSIPAIVVGTVDMIGSRLLFGGYGVSPKMRAYHAGFLGADTLVVLDESHLVPPFQALLRRIQDGKDVFGPREEHRSMIPPFRLMSLSATGSDEGRGFQFQPADLTGDDIAQDRWGARKTLQFHQSEGKTIAELADLAWDLSGRGREPIRCVVFCNERETAERVLEELRKRSKDAELELLVGARRVEEREKVKCRLESLGFFGPVGQRKLTYLVATSAGEVGVDLDAEHMVCDLVAWERMVQRLGRVNRRGKGSARISVLQPLPDPKDEDKNVCLAAVTELLRLLPLDANEGHDCSPAALSGLKQRKDLAEKLRNATTPPPLRPSLERAHVEAWSMTSLPEEDPGRAEIRPWIRGWVPEEPQTIVCWRRYLPTRNGETKVGRYLKEVNRFFEAAPIHLTEQLQTETHRVIKWLGVRALQMSVGQVSPDTTIGYVLSSSGGLKSHTLKKEGRTLTCLRLADLTIQDKEASKSFRDNLHTWLSEATLVLACGFAGLSEEGLLSTERAEPPMTLDSSTEWQNKIGLRVRESDEPYPEPLEQDRDWTQRYRFVSARQNDKPTKFLLVEKLRLASTTEDDRSEAPDKQSLLEHQSQAESVAHEIAGRLGLPAPYRLLLCVAARHHDEGKSAPNWQRAFRAPTDDLYAKTKGPIDFKVLAGYRHEFGSLSLAEPFLTELSEDLRELGLHLIAAHHGYARPYIRTEGCYDSPPSVLQERACQVALRFARLQGIWGPWGLAWWESLLRAVDQKASRLGQRAEGMEAVGVRH